MMGEIYSKATSVIVWLGELTFDIETMTKTCANELASKVWLDSTDGIHELFTKDYWTRAWIVQEYILAAKVELWCGQFSLAEEVLPSFVETLHRRPLGVLLQELEDTEHITKAIFIIDCTAKKAVNYRRLRPQLNAFWSLMAFACDMQCADVRDRVFSLMGFTDAREANLLSDLPNYLMSPSELFSQVLKVAFNRHQVLHLRDALGLCNKDKNVREALTPLFRK